LRVFWPAYILRDFNRNARDYNKCKRYQAYEAFEKRARSNPTLIKKIARGDFYEVAKSEHEVKLGFLKLGPNNFEAAKVQQNLIKKYLLTKEEEETMSVKAFNKNGISKVKLMNTNIMTLDQLNKHAIAKAGGLPTREELKAAGVHLGDGNNFWQPVITKNGKLDLCQIGNHRISGNRYVLWSEEPDNKYSNNWMNEAKPFEFRPLHWMYVKKSAKKSSVFQPNVQLQDEESLLNKNADNLAHLQQNVSKKQLEIRRWKIDYISENKMVKNAFEEHNLVRIPINHALTWVQADIIAKKFAAGLPTREDLMKAQVNEGETNFWMYVQRSDDKEDVVQIGTHPEIKERYFSHLKELGDAKWLKDQKPEDMRPSDYIYAKRCPQKNLSYDELLTDEAKKELYEQKKQEKEKDLKAVTKQKSFVIKTNPQIKKKQPRVIKL